MEVPPSHFPTLSDVSETVSADTIWPTINALTKYLMDLGVDIRAYTRRLQRSGQLLLGEMKELEEDEQNRKNQLELTESLRAKFDQLKKQPKQTKKQPMAFDVPFSSPDSHTANDNVAEMSAAYVTAYDFTMTPLDTSAKKKKSRRSRSLTRVASKLITPIRARSICRQKLFDDL